MDDVEAVLQAAFGDARDLAARHAREERTMTLAIGLGRSRSDIKAQLAGADDPREELRALERRYRNLSVGVVRRAERRETELLAESSRAKHDGVRESAEAELRGRRLRMTLGQRFDDALARAELLTTVTAAKPGVGARTKPDSREPPKAFSVAERYTTVVAVYVEMLEREVDTASRQPLTGRAETETREARDRRLLACEGVPSHIVSALDPTLGSPRTVENDRYRLGRRRSDGSPLVERKTGGLPS